MSVENNRNMESKPEFDFVYKERVSNVLARIAIVKYESMKTERTIGFCCIVTKIRLYFNFTKIWLHVLLKIVAKKETYSTLSFHWWMIKFWKAVSNVKLQWNFYWKSVFILLVMLILGVISVSAFDVWFFSWLCFGFTICLDHCFGVVRVCVHIGVAWRCNLVLWVPPYCMSVTPCCDWAVLYQSYCIVCGRFHWSSHHIHFIMVCLDHIILLSRWAHM